MVAVMSLAKRSWIVVAIVAIAAAVLGQRQFGTHNTPAGQPALLHLSTASVETLRSDFNRASGDVRVILLLSPT
jgi:hypothetical protein